MGWALAFAIRTATLLALANAMRACLTHTHNIKARILHGRGISPSLLLTSTFDAGRGQ
jgi:hypothetical protein